MVLLKRKFSDFFYTMTGPTPTPLAKQCSKTIQSGHPNKAFIQLDVMRREGRFTDIVLVAEGRRFQAHRAVLCACSPYFDR